VIAEPVTVSHRFSRTDLSPRTLQCLLARGLVDSRFGVAYGNYTDAALLQAPFSGVDPLLFMFTGALGEERRVITATWSTRPTAQASGTSSSLSS
jgi:hypothetical protein